MEDLIGKSVWIEEPVKPQHFGGYGVITDVHAHPGSRLNYEIQQLGTKQWYGNAQFFPHEFMELVTQEDICEKHYEDKKAWMESISKQEQTKLCDQYKEAISEVTEDMKERSKKEVEEMFNQKVYPIDRMKEDEGFKQICEMYAERGNAGLRINSTFTGVEPIIFGKPYKTCAEIYGNTYMTKEEKHTTKKALALLAEQKQNELKEIEELIKKL